MRFRAAVAIVTAGCILASCTGGAATSTNPPASTVAAAPTTIATSPLDATPAPTAPALRFDGTVAIGGGGSLAARCLGVGSPTILLEAGGTEGSMDDWGPVFPVLLAYHTTVCMYSHPGGSGSSPAGNPLTWAEVLANANAVLDTVHRVAGIDGPYVFVGWSFGGEVALGEALANPARTAGLVILDTDYPVDFMSVCQAAGRTKANCQTEYDGDLEAKLIERDLVKTIKPLPGVPIALVSAIRPGPDCAVGAAGTATYSVGGKDLTAPDCPTLLQKVADYDLTQWRSLGPQVVQTKVDADHDRMIAGVGRQIVDIIVAMLPAPS